MLLDVGIFIVSISEGGAHSGTCLPSAPIKEIGPMPSSAEGGNGFYQT